MTAFPLQRESATPIYRQLENWMREQILSGAWALHSQLRSEPDLAAELNVNRGTLRKAMDTLIDEGLLIRVHGRGTFVASQTITQPLADHLTTFSEDLIGKNIPFKTRVLAQEIVSAPEGVASALDLDVNQSVFYLRRVRDVEGTPFALLENYVVHRYTPRIEQIDFTQMRLFEALEMRYGLQIETGRRDFEARLADRQTAELLHLAPDSAVMFLTQLAFLRDGIAVEYSRVWLRGDQFRLSAVVKRGRAELFGERAE